MVQIEALNVFKGEKKLPVMSVELPEDREKLAEAIKGFLKAGNALFLIQNKEQRRIESYIPKTNEWVLRPEGKMHKKDYPRVSAENTHILLVAPSQGG